MSPSENALLARKTWRTVEPIHGMIYFVPEAVAAYAAVGVTGRNDGYFASRAAPMGEVAPAVVVATFYNFNPELIHAALPTAWAAATPAQLVEARLVAVDGAMRRLLGDSVVASPEMARAALLARTAAEEVAPRTSGRPLAAAHAELPWPEDPHLVLWHAQSILREYRGDGHIALLVTHGLSGLDALITHAASGDIPAELLRVTRGWPVEAWDAAVQSLRDRGWLTEGEGVGDADLAFTGSGSAWRHEIEEGTDELAAAPYIALGEERCAELRALTRPWSKIFAEVLGR